MAQHRICCAEGLKPSSRVEQSAQSAAEDANPQVWHIHIDDVGSTQARHLRELDDMTKDLIVIKSGTYAGQITVEYDIILPDPVNKRLAHAEELRTWSSAAQSEAAAEMRAAARAMHDDYAMPLRDIGQALGISHQRAGQLVKQ